VQVDGKTVAEKGKAGFPDEDEVVRTLKALG
jgi:hypothetical protein